MSAVCLSVTGPCAVICQRCRVHDLRYRAGLIREQIEKVEQLMPRLGKMKLDLVMLEEEINKIEEGSR